MITPERQLELRKRVHLIDHKGTKMLMQDYSGLRQVEEMRFVGDLCHKFFRSQLPKSVLAITNVTGTLYNPEIIKMAGEFAKRDGPYTKAECLIGITGMTRLFVNTVSRMAGHDYYVARDLDDAKQWLYARQA